MPQGNPRRNREDAKSSLEIWQCQHCKRCWLQKAFYELPAALKCFIMSFNCHKIWDKKTNARWSDAEKNKNKMSARNQGYHQHPLASELWYLLYNKLTDDLKQLSVAILQNLWIDSQFTFLTWRKTSCSTQMQRALFFQSQMNDCVQSECSHTIFTV